MVRRTTRAHFLVVLTHLLVDEDMRTLEFCYPVQDKIMQSFFRLFNIPAVDMIGQYQENIQAIIICIKKKKK